MPISLARVAQIKIGSFKWYQSQVDLLCMFKTLIKYETPHLHSNRKGALMDRSAYRSQVRFKGLHFPFDGSPIACRGAIASFALLMTHYVD